MRTIAIIFHDNDFGTTFMNLLDTLKRVFEYHGANSEPLWLTAAMGRPQPEVLTRENVEYMIRMMVISHYAAFQYSFRPKDYGTDHEPSPVAHEHHLAGIAEYLSKFRVLFDEEAEADIAKEWRNGEAWYLELQTGIIRSY
jgi:hypothetical protein